MNAGQTVKFIESLEAGDEARRFKVLELRGDRVLVEDITAQLKGLIKPTHVFLIAELTEA